MILTLLCKLSLYIRSPAPRYPREIAPTTKTSLVRALSLRGSNALCNASQMTDGKLGQCNSRITERGQGYFYLEYFKYHPYHQSSPTGSVD